MKPRTRRSADIALIEFLRPDIWWPQPYSIEMAFQALRWLIASAVGDRYIVQHQWHRSCAVGLLGGEGAENGGCRPIRSLADLQSRFQAALLARTEMRPEIVRWREDKGIRVDAVINMAFRHYKPLNPPAHLPWRSEADVQEALTRLLQKSGGAILTTQLNPVHAGAKVVHRVEIIVGATGFRFLLRYGFHDPAVEPMDSEWTHHLATTEGDEPFLDTLARAVANFAQLTTVAKLAA